MQIDKIQQELDDIKKEYDAKLAEIRNIGLTKILEEFFEENPDITGIAFNGYVPSFNDGDPCVFTLADVAFSRNPNVVEIFKEEDSAYYADSESVDDWDLNQPMNFIWDEKTKKGERVPNENYSESLAAISNFISKNDELMNDFFGDNFRVLITPNEIIQEYYDCGW